MNRCAKRKTRRYYLVILGSIFGIKYGILFFKFPSGAMEISPASHVNFESLQSLQGGWHIIFSDGNRVVGEMHLFLPIPYDVNCVKTGTVARTIKNDIAIVR